MTKWEPSEKVDNEKRKEYTRLLYRGVVRDNGYTQASDCVEVSLVSPVSQRVSLRLIHHPVLHTLSSPLHKPRAASIWFNLLSRFLLIRDVLNRTYRADRITER